MLADEIVAFLASEGLGTVDDNLIATKMPDTPDRCGAVFETGGSEPEYGLGETEPAIENPTLQIVFRGNPHDYDWPRLQANNAFKVIGKLRKRTELTGVPYYVAQPLQPPFPFNRRTPDPRERPLIAFNVAFQKEPSTT